MSGRSPTMKMIGNIAGIVGLIIAFAALGYVLVTGSWDYPRYFLIAALVLLVVYIWLNPEVIAGALTGRGTRYGANTALRIVAAVGIAIALYAIWGLLAPRIGSGFGRIDVTANQQFTLSKLTSDTLSNLSQSVTALAFFTTSDSGRQDTENLLKEYAARSSNFKYEFVDPNSDVLRARQYNLTRSGVVIFDNGQRHEQAASNTEQEFTAAMLRLRETGTKTIAVLDVPSMVDFTGSGPQQQISLSLVKTELTNENYVWLDQPWNLVISPTITINNVTVLIVPPSPTDTPLTDLATRAIIDYLDRGGHVLLMGDPEAAPLPKALLDKYGLTEWHDIVLESELANVWALGGQPQPYNVSVNTYPDSTITKAMTNLRTYYSVAEAIQPPTSTITGFLTTPIVQSSATSSMAKIIPAQGSNPATLQDDPAAPKGPLTLIVSVEQQTAGTTSTITNTTTTTQTDTTRLVVLGDADFASDSLTQLTLNNRDLFTNIVNWLAQSEDRITVSPPSTTSRTLTLSAEQQSFIFYGTVLFLPILILLLGGYIWWRRR